MAEPLRSNRLILSGWLSGEPCARGRALSYWLDALHDNTADHEHRAKQAMDALVAIGPDAIPALREILLTPDPPNVRSVLFEERPFVPRYRAAWCLYQMGEPGRPAFREALCGRQQLSHTATVSVLAKEQPLPVDLLLEGIVAHTQVEWDAPNERPRWVSHWGDAMFELHTLRVFSRPPLSSEEVNRLVAAAIAALRHTDPELRLRAAAYLWEVACWPPYSPGHPRDKLRHERLEAVAKALRPLVQDGDARISASATGALSALEKEHGIKVAK